MTGADGGADPGARPKWRWDVALSFAAAQRDYVEQVARALKARGVRCFYDADQLVRLWGRNLAEELPRIYSRESAAVVVFISADYAEGDWTRLECRAALARAVREAGVYVLPARFDDSELPGLLPDVVAVDLRRYTPGQFADLVVVTLADLAGNPVPVPGEVGRVPTGGVRVSEADPRRLGVHAAISVPGVPDEAPPEYVPRDADVAEHGVRARVAAAAERGGLVLLVGGSSVGKTRCAVEAVRALLPDWWLVHPAAPGEIAALAAAPATKTVVWLDEMQRFLDGERGLTGGVMRALLNAPHPVVVIGTLWPDLYSAYTAVPASGDADPHAREREVLDVADIVGIGPEFSPAEQGRAHAAAARDPRLSVALGAPGYGLTQTLAAAPQLVARWDGAQIASPYAWAVLTAALDAARLGARAPLSAEFLRAAAPGYCTSQQQAEAPATWFEQAVTYAKTKLHGAAAALSPAGGGMGQVAGYTPADYLIQHASRERRYERLPASTWDAIVSHIRDPADTARLADSARRRLLYRYAIPLYLRAADAGDEFAARQLARLLAARGDLDELRARADAGDEDAAVHLALLLADRGDLDELRARADAGDPYAASELNALLWKRGDPDAAEQILRARTADHIYAPLPPARLVAERVGIGGPRHLADAHDQFAMTQSLQAQAAAGDEEETAWRQADLLAERGDLDGAEQILRARTNAGDMYAALRLARLLAKRGDLDGLRARAVGDRNAARVLAGLLADHGDLDGLRAQADHGDLDGLRAQADAGDDVAARVLADLLTDRGDLDGLHARVDAGDEYAALRLPELLTEQGRGEEAERLRRFGLNPDGSIAQV